MRPNVLILAAGHTGTRALAEVLFAAGWNHVDADEFSESVRFKYLNRMQADQGRDIPLSRAERMIESLGEYEPWCLKDPRLALTWPFWWKLFPTTTAVVYFSRNLERVRQSYLRRYQHTRSFGRDVTSLIASAKQGFEAWTGPKLALTYEDLTAGVAVFDLDKAK